MAEAEEDAPPGAAVAGALGGGAVPDGHEGARPGRLRRQDGVFRREDPHGAGGSRRRRHGGEEAQQHLHDLAEVGPRLRVLLPARGHHRRQLLRQVVRARPNVLHHHRHHHHQSNKKKLVRSFFFSQAHNSFLINQSPTGAPRRTGDDCNENGSRRTWEAIQIFSVWPSSIKQT